jgi:hypothetical protein
MEFIGFNKFDPKDYEAETKQSVGNQTTEKVNMMGVDVTLMMSYEYKTKLLRFFGALDKKFAFANIKDSKMAPWAHGKKKVHITKSDLCAKEWAKDDMCHCQGNVYFGTWSSIMEEKEQKMKFKENVNGTVKCSNSEFGDPLAGAKKECYCEHKPRVMITPGDKCAEEGKD